MENKDKVIDLLMVALVVFAMFIVIGSVLVHFETDPVVDAVETVPVGVEFINPKPTEK